MADAAIGIAPARPLAGRSLHWVHPTALIVGAIIVFLPHFRPWEVGFLEEWPLAADWGTDHGAFTSDYFAWTLSRPLHLIPGFLGLAVTGGAPGGIFLILGLVAAGQFVLTVWALRPVSRSFWLSAAIGLFVALHPLWPGGYLQRFVSAQTAALAMAVAAGLLIRWLTGGRRRHVVLAGVTMLLGLCFYPGPAAASPLLALVLALALPATWRRRIVAVAVGVGASAVMTVYSLVIAPFVSPDGSTYEEANIEAAAVRTPREFVSLVATTYLDYGLLLIAGILAVAVLGAVLALTGAVPDRTGWLITGAAILSPLCTVVYFGHIGWLQDVDRLGYVTSLGLVVALLVWPATSTGQRPQLQAVLAVVLVLVCGIGAVRGVQRWQPYIALQHQLLSTLRPVVAQAHGDEQVVVIDHSGTFGGQYTFPLQYLSSASQVMNHDDTRVWLCFEKSDPHPLPSGGVACRARDTGTGLRLATTLSLPGGAVDIYLSHRPEH